LVSRTWNGAASGMCGSANISGDGLFIAYTCFAPDVLPPNYPTAHGRLYLLDRALNYVVPIDITPNGGAPNGSAGGGSFPHVSADGNYVVFACSSPNLLPVNTPPIILAIMRWSRMTGNLEVVNLAVDGSFVPNPYAIHDSISADGQRVLFRGFAFQYINLPQANPTTPHVFVRDMVAGTTTLVSTDQDGVLSSFFYNKHLISEDGNRILFSGGQWASVPVSLTQPNWTYEKNLTTGAVRPIGLGAPNTVGFSGYSGNDTTERSISVIYTEAPSMLPGSSDPESYAVFTKTGRFFRPAELPDGTPISQTAPLSNIIGTIAGATICENGRWALIQSNWDEFPIYMLPLPIADPVTEGYSASYPAPFLNVKPPEGGLSVAYARWCPPSQPGYLAMTLNATASVVSLAGGGVSAVIPYGSAMSIQSDAQGLVKLPFPWPSVLTGHVVHAQMAMVDPSAPAGYVLTDTVRLQLP
ncbi:MAG TPA: hypothetical protein PKA37_15485, partial [Planctomycetota bacterium]|nr:hypothetical protein [Planctomycetota bacterium]